jgi:hypothetical protein
MTKKPGPASLKLGRGLNTTGPHQSFDEGGEVSATLLRSPKSEIG